MPAAALALRNVETPGRRGDGPLRGVSLVIPAGALCALTGENGCGASTLVRVIADRHGDALFADPAALVSRASVYDNIALGLARRGVAKADGAARALQAAETMGLTPLLARAARGLSADERWRVVLARVLAHRPSLLLFDEPLAGVAPALRMELRRAFRRIQRETGATVVYATADVADALALADLFVAMRDGVVLQSGPPASVYAAPVDAAAARLTGPFGINLLPVRADPTGLSLEDGTTLGAAGLRTTARMAVLGVRPEHLTVHDDAVAPSGGLRLPLRVDAAEPTGADTFLHGHVGPHAVTARLAGAVDAAPGAIVQLGAAPELLHMFDADTLRALAKPTAAQRPAVVSSPPAPAAPVPPHLQRDPRGDEDERAGHERRLAAARARLSS